MFEEEAIDAVEVLTDPGEIRLRIMQDAIERDLHVFVEKPMVFLGVNRLAESILASQHLVSVAESKGLVVMTGFVKRFSSPYQVALHLINSEALGELSMVAVKMCQGWSRHILLEGQACHMLDMARYLGGEIKGLQALAVNRYGESSYPYDNVVVNVEFASGAIGTLYFSSSSLSLKPWERVEIFGERKWLAVEDGMSTTLHDSEQGPSKSWAPVFPNTLLFDEEFGGYVPEIKNFLDAIRGDAAALASGEDGVAALILASMIHESAKARRFVSWDEIQPEHKK
jgi:UDP-N-acetylglucosamine 3-dehydrogenase